MHVTGLATTGEKASSTWWGLLGSGSSLLPNLAHLLHGFLGQLHVECAAVQLCMQLSRFVLHVKANVSAVHASMLLANIWSSGSSVLRWSDQVPMLLCCLWLGTG